MSSSAPKRLVTIVLDDDPTGTQEVTDVPVLLRRDSDSLERLVREHDAVFILTNSRALPEAEAVALIRGLLDDIHSVERSLGVEALVVQRGDSTLRGHVFAEIDAADQDAVVVFCPAFPAGGRRTVDGVHLVRVGGEWLNAADTEFAADPVFGYRARSQEEYVAEKGRGRRGVSLAAADVGDALRSSPPGTVLLPDAADDDDIALLAQQIQQARVDGVRLVVRSAAPLAAFLAGAKSRRMLDADDAARACIRSRLGGILVVVGSHTAATTEQLAALAAEPMAVHEVATADALRDPEAAGRALAAAARSDLRAGAVVISSERHRRSEHSSLTDADAVMRALIAATQQLAPFARAVVAKGGITSAEVARTGLGRGHAWVAGQLEAGVSLWVLPDSPEAVRPPGLLYAVVPGNIGTRDTLRDVSRVVATASMAGDRR
jgi:Uncharacterized protein conserved in bacteria